MHATYELLLRGNNLSFRGGFFGFCNVALVTSESGRKVLFDTGHYCLRKGLLALQLPVDSSAVEELRSLQGLYRKAIKAASPRDIRIWNDRFHDRLFTLAPNPLLVDEVRRYTRMTDPIRSTGIVDQAWLARAAREHDALVDCLEHGDLPRLKLLVLAHMEPVRDRWLAARSARLVA
jgi:DNA-binding GntR family transcriptional regulator